MTPARRGKNVGKGEEKLKSHVTKGEGGRAGARTGRLYKKIAEGG